MDSSQPSQRRRRIIQGCIILTATTALILAVCFVLGIGTTSLRVMPDSQGVSIALQPGWRATTTAEVYATQTGEVRATRTQVAAETATRRADLYATGTQMVRELNTVQAEITQQTATASALQATGTQLGILQMTVQAQGTSTADAATLTARPSTTESARVDLLAQAEDWRLILTSAFNIPRPWIRGSYEEDGDSIDYSVRDGVYRWEIVNGASSEGIPWWSLYRDYERHENTFALSVDGRTVEGSSVAYFGLVFHIQERDWSEFYTVILSDRTLVEAYWVHDGNWEDIISQRAYRSVRRDQPNRLTVVAQDSLYDIYVNGEWIAQVENDDLSEGWLGLIAGVFGAGARTVIEFDNFEFRAP